MRHMSNVGVRVEHAKKSLAVADAVCFDVDSTVIVDEGIDELAAYLGCGEQESSHVGLCVHVNAASLDNIVLNTVLQ